MDVHFFAGVRTVLTFAVTPEGSCGRSERGSGTRASSSTNSRAAIEKALAKEREGDIDGMLAITFAHRDPNRTHVVPAVPG